VKRADKEKGRYWLVKSEPSVYSFADLQRDGRTRWDGVRNYQARNLLRDEVQVGDGVLFYHSSEEPMAVAGVARVVRRGYPDPTAFDEKGDHFDPDSDPAEPTWFAVDIAPAAAFRVPVTRAMLKAAPGLSGMMVLARGSRLSVQPVTPAEWLQVLALGGADVAF
jgi:predicted RNA-binding protein with PUA-like domain